MLSQTTNVRDYDPELIKAIDALDKAVARSGEKTVIAKMTALRTQVDELEAIIPDDLWPLPSYAEMMFMM